MAFPAPNGTNSSGSPIYPLGIVPSQTVLELGKSPLLHEGATSTPIATPGSTTGINSGLLPNFTSNLGTPSQSPSPNFNIASNSLNLGTPTANSTPVIPSLTNFNTVPPAPTPAPPDVILTTSNLGTFTGPPPANLTQQSNALGISTTTPTGVPDITSPLLNPTNSAENAVPTPNPSSVPGNVGNGSGESGSGGTAVGNPTPSTTPVPNNNVAAPSQSTAATTLPTNEINYQIPFFLQSILSTPAGALPKGPLWVVTFENSYDTTAGVYIGNSGIPSIVKSINQYEPNIPRWNVVNAINTICSDNFMTTKGCILTQNVTLPGEQIYHTTEGLQYNGFIRGVVGNGRQDFETLRIGFLNTNVSFVDNVMRPWVIMTGHLGMIDRSGTPQQYRSTLTVRRLGVSSAKEAPFILQTFTFYGVCPIGVDAEEYTTSDNGTVVVKTVTFVYQWYTVDSSKNNYAQGPVASLTNTNLGVVATPNVGVQIYPPAGSTFPSAVTPYNLS
jgi:hypothetical protein